MVIQIDVTTSVIIFTSILMGGFILFLRTYRKILFRGQSSISGSIIEVKESIPGIRFLYIDKVSQGQSTTRKRSYTHYWYHIASLCCGYVEGKANSLILVLGLGAHTTTSLITQQCPYTNITVVEHDDIIIQICRRFFNLVETPHLSVISSDAFAFLDSQISKNIFFDVIVIDLFVSTSPALAEDINNNIQKASKILKSNGLLIINWPRRLPFRRISIEQILGHLHNVFHKVHRLAIVDNLGNKNDIAVGLFPMVLSKDE
jgi:spermidine synthase